jgi:5,6,7,8-tetrahydromethanopterin hydro-lyase
MSRLAREHRAVNRPQGFPDFPAPDLLKEAAARAIHGDINQYAITWGAQSLRDAIARKYAAWYGLDADPEREITVTCGATEAMISTLLAVVTPTLPAKPDALLFNKVTIKGAKQAVQMFGPAQAAVARAVMDSVSEGIIPKDKANDYVVLVGVFIHWQAASDEKIYKFNYQATKESIQRALAGKPTVDDVLAKYKDARHPFSGISTA